MASMLEQLPDELILEIFGHLRPARLLVHAPYQPEHNIYSVGISSDTSVTTFASLCLTTKHLGLLATPELYGNLIESEASRKLPYLSFPGQVSRSEHYLRRFFEFCKAVVRRPSHGQHLRYVNHSFDTSDKLELCRTYALDERWSSHRKAMKRLASQIWRTAQLQVWTGFFVLHPEQAQFVLLLALAPNVTHIVTDFHEKALSTILSLLNMDMPLSDKQQSRIHGFDRLERVIFTMRNNWFYGRSMANYESPFLPAAPARQLLPQITSLRYFQQVLDPSTDIYDLNPQPNLVMHKIETLNLYGCTVNLKLVAGTVRSCTSLKSFVFSPAETNKFFDFRTLYSALRRSIGTLENIFISMGESFEGDIHQEPLGTFSDFSRLKRLRVPDIVMMGKPESLDVDGPDYNWTDFRPKSSLIQLLPPNLEYLFLTSEFVGFSDSTEFLWEFARNLNQLPRLRSFGSAGGRSGPFARLSDELAERGIDFTESDFAPSGEWLGMEV